MNNNDYHSPATKIFSNMIKVAKKNNIKPPNLKEELQTNKMLFCFMSAIIQYLDEKEGFETEITQDGQMISRRKLSCHHCYCKFNRYTQERYCCECGEVE